MPVPINELNECMCGGVAVYKQDKDGIFVNCIDCENRTASFSTKRQAQKEWNLRIRWEGENWNDDEERDREFWMWFYDRD